jgi:glycosyltransferase involved in cell wall biosynthesis
MAGEDPRDALSSMRILHLGKYFPPVAGGIERFLGDLVGEQRRSGDEAAVLAHADRAAPHRDDPAWLMRCPVWMRLIFAPISPFYALWLARAIRRYSPEVLHIHMPNVSPFWALLVPSARRLPWVIHWHSDVEPSRFRLSLRLAYPHYRILERAMLDRAQCIIATSPQYLATSRPLEAWRHKCHVVPLGVDRARLPEPGAQKDPVPWTQGAFRALAVGRLAYYKGFETLVRAAADASGTQVLIAGDGEERAALEALAARHGDGRVRLLGEVDDATLCGLLASCDVLCLPSRERTEAFGLVLVEAMRYAKPLLVADIPGSGVTFVGRDGQNAVVVPVEDVAALRSALASMAAQPARRRLLGQLGAERFAREFDIASVARRIDAIYRLALSLAGEERRSPEPATAAELFGPPTAEPRAPSPRRGRLLVVIPALNEADCIEPVVRNARAIPGVDVLLVDDGSTDDTAAVALLSGATVIRAPLWQGAWGAIQTGLRYAMRHGYEGVVTMDADGQHEAVHVPRLIAAAQGADVVIAACPARGSRLRHAAWRYFRFLTGFALEDLTSGFRYYNRSACALLASKEATLLDYQDIGVLLLLRRAGLRIAEIPVEMNPRRSGASRVFSSWWTVARYMAETSLLCLARWGARH